MMPDKPRTMIDSGVAYRLRELFDAIHWGVSEAGISAKARRVMYAVEAGCGMAEDDNLDITFTLSDVLHSDQREPAPEPEKLDIGAAQSSALAFDRKLRSQLSDTDPLWVTWGALLEALGFERGTDGLPRKPGEELCSETK